MHGVTDVSTFSGLEIPITSPPAAAHCSHHISIGEVPRSSTRTLRHPLHRQTT